MLKVTDLHVRYGTSVTALTDVSLSVSEGEVVAVLGANGAGKSTLLRALSGTLLHHHGRVTRGSIEFEGRNLLGASPRGIVRAGLIQSPEGRRIFTQMSVEENLRVAAAGAGIATRDVAALRRTVWELFPRLEERCGQSAGLLSGGEQQMLAIGRALMARPRLLLLDEPSLGLAPQMVDLVGTIVQEIHSRGTSVLLVEQNAAMALSVADRAVVLANGSVCATGAAKELAASDGLRELYLGGAPAPTLDGAPQ
jgi:branched-chain amino acid transport system ATP-binding protein